MIRFLFPFILLLLGYPATVQGNTLLFEGGLGVHTSSNSQVAFLRYQLDSAPLFGFDSYYSIAFASWNEKNRNAAAVITRGIRFELTDRAHFDFEAGGAYLKKTTENLGTRLQFAFRFALGAKVGKFDIGLGYDHFSNGKGVFQWTHRSNLGENFITLHLGYFF